MHRLIAPFHKWKLLSFMLNFIIICMKNDNVCNAQFRNVFFFRFHLFSYLRWSVCFLFSKEFHLQQLDWHSLSCESISHRLEISSSYQNDGCTKVNSKWRHCNMLWIMYLKGQNFQENGNRVWISPVIELLNYFVEKETCLK